MNTKHTPGPWTIGDENNQHVEICIGDAVANLERQDRYGLHMVFSREEMRANARLIVAAPELLEALCDMVSDRNELSDGTLCFAKAAIDKATGEGKP